MKYTIRDILEYTIAIVSEFASKFNLTEKQAYRYISFHKDLNFIEENYGKRPQPGALLQTREVVKNFLYH